MSELIVRMEMPQGCDDCPFRDMLLCCCAKGRKYVGSSPVRPDWCPIVCELPEQHGALIDMRELLKRKIKMDWSVLEWVHEVDICAARVIVPATKRSEYDN